MRWAAKTKKAVPLDHLPHLAPFQRPTPRPVMCCRRRLNGAAAPAGYAIGVAEAQVTGHVVQAGRALGNSRRNPNLV